MSNVVHDDPPFAEQLRAPRRWRIRVDLRGLENRRLLALRVLLVADVVRRLVEVRGGQALVALVHDRGADPDTAAAGELHIPAPDAIGAAIEPHLLSAAPDVVLLAADSPPEVRRDVPTGVRAVLVGDVVTPGANATESILSSELLGDADPLSLRLALLRFRSCEPATLSRARLHRACETLQRWRVKVAGWADMPSAPAVSDGRVAAMRNALDAGLDTAAALTLLHRVEVDVHLASGSKFETFADLDRILALNLSRLVGKLPR